MYYFSLILVPIFALSANFMYEVVRFNFFPKFADHVRICERRGPVAPQLGRVSPGVSGEGEVPADDSTVHKGFAFSQADADGATVTQADLIRKYNTNNVKPTGE